MHLYPQKLIILFSFLSFFPSLSVHVTEMRLILENIRLGKADLRADNLHIYLPSLCLQILMKYTNKPVINNG